MSIDNFSFRVTVETHDRTGEVLAVYFQVRKGKTKTTREHADGNVFADYDRHGRLLGVEMLAPCRASVLDNIARQASAKQFIRRAIPHGMLMASS
jgi:uncharacterized protein YuzE